MAKLMAIFVGFLALLAAADGARAACKPGTPNCVQGSDIKRPQPFGGPTNPCTIDGGFGSQCQGNNVNCGNAMQGKVNVYDPSGRSTTGTTVPKSTTATGGALRR